MHRWEDDEEEALVVARVMAGRWRVRLASGEEITAGVSGFLWFRQIDPSIGDVVRIVRTSTGPERATIVHCRGGASGRSA